MIVGIEHFLLLLKGALKQLIPDIPKAVEKADAKRPKVEKRAYEYIAKLNNEDNLGTFEEYVKSAFDQKN